MRINDKKARIAIVGAGPAGLFAARLLKRSSYENVVLYEKENMVAGVTKSVEVDGLVHDYSTKFIPTSTLSGPRIYPPLDRLLKDYRMELVDSADSTVLDVRSRKVVDLPFIQKFGSIQLLTELIEGFRLLNEIDELPDVQDVIDAQVCRADETITEWGARMKLPALTAMMVFLTDAFSGSSGTNSYDMPAAAVLKGRALFYSGYIRAAIFKAGFKGRFGFAVIRLIGGLLGGLGIKSRAFPKVCPALSELIAAGPQPINKVIKTGYQSFFDALVQHEGLDVRLSSPVTSLRHIDGGGIEIDAANCAPERYDAVVLACEPAAALQFLGADEPVVPHWQKVDTDPPVISWMLRAKGWPTDIAGPRGIVFLVPQSEELGTAAYDFDGRPYAVSKEYEQSDVLVVPVNVKPGTSIDDARRELLAGLEQAGIQVTEELGYQCFDYPRTIDLEALAAGFYKDIGKLQGQRGMYYIGEIFSGAGIPSVLNHVRAVVPRYFADIEAT